MQISNGPIFQEPTDAGIKHDSNNEHVSCYTILKRRCVCCPQLRTAFIKQTNQILPNIHSEPFTKWQTKHRAKHAPQNASVAHSDF